MKTLTRLVSSAAAIAVLSAAPARAAGVDGAVVPPSNSAATQYTETFPTSGGDKKTDQKPTHSSPSKVLGSHNAQKLQEQGPEGQAAAEAAAATAPSTIETETTAAAPSESGSKDSGTGSGSADRGHLDDGNAALGQAIAVSEAPPSSAELPTGSSGIGSAFEQATGLSTSGQSGMLLPLVILATILCSFAYLWRQRRQVD